MQPTQSYHLRFERFAPQISIHSFTATEALNQSYRISIELTSPDPRLPLADYLNQHAHFSITPASSDAFSRIAGMIAPEPLKQWHGIITRADKLDSSADQTRYRLILEPRIAALAHHTTSRLFQNQTIPDIIAAVLKHHRFNAVDYRIHSSRDYPIREYTTQYQESDYAFINRLCEEEGIWYTFEQDEQHRDIILFGDSTAHYRRDQRLPIPYRPHAGLEAVGSEAIFSLNIRHNPILHSIRINDYNYRDADTDLSAEISNRIDNEKTDNSQLLGSQSHWGLHHKTPAEAKVQTALLQQHNQSRQTEARGEGNSTALSPGAVFHSERNDSEAPDGWLTLSIRHSGSRDSAYHNQFSAIPAHKNHRPDRNTPQPHINGSLPARITSPGHYTYAYLDAMGRYRVKLPFDLDEWSPGGESRPIRLAKPYAGADYGQHFPLHEGTEVMLGFVQGNPDRPYISGVMHDSSHADHIDQQWNTRNVIRTRANNKLRMEDKQNEEHIKLATDYGKSQLNLGHIVNSERDKRGDNGEGFELRTDSWGAVRAGKGLFLSADAQNGAQGAVHDQDAAIAQLEQALSLAKSLNKAAKVAKSEGTLSDEQERRLNHCIKELKEAVILISSPAGIASATAQSQLHTAGEHLHLISGADTNISSGKNFTAHAAESLNLFAQSGGMKMQANQGKVVIQAQNDEMQLNALKDTTMTSSAGKITIAAKDEILLTSGGGYIKIANGEVEIGCPTMVRVKCAGFAVTGPSEHKQPLPRFTVSKGVDVYYQYDNLMPVVNAPFDLYFEDGTIISGKLDENGYAHIEDAPNGRFHAVFGEDAREWLAEEETRKQTTYTEAEIHQAWGTDNPAESMPHGAINIL